jgi:hypothetical protein
VTAPWANPELLRNARIQLRPGRAIAAAIICAAISLTAWSYSAYSNSSEFLTGGRDGLFKLTLGLQVIILLIGGGIACLQSVHREKELNTFDYQRVTRLTSLELAIGKLFGAPIIAYFVVLCLVPLAIFAAIFGHVSAWPFLQAYIIVLLGCVAYHALALLASMMMGRGGSAIVIFLFLILIAITSSDTGGEYSNWQIHQFSPFAVTSVAMWGQQEVRWHDTFFSWSVPHFTVLVVLYVIFAAWFLLGITRNLKRDPAVYEIYSPVQAFCFALYLSFLLLGFFHWAPPAPPRALFGFSLKGYSSLPLVEIEQSLLFDSAWIFFALGLLLLRNRERVRRRVRAMGDSAAGWWSSLWPAPYVFGGLILVGLGIIESIWIYRHPDRNWDIQAALFEVALCAIWITRDVLYLQWMNLRRARRPLLVGFLYLMIFYTCAGILFGVLSRVMSERAIVLSALLVPSQLLPRVMGLWPANQGLLIGILAGLAAEALLFAFLQRQKLRAFIAPPVVVPVVTPRKPSLMPR